MAINGYGRLRKMGIRTSLTISEASKNKAEKIKDTLPFLKSFGAVVEYCIAHVHEEATARAVSTRFYVIFNSVVVYPRYSRFTYVKVRM